MKKKIGIGIVAISFVASFVFLGTACSKQAIANNDTEGEQTHTVTFDANGGAFFSGAHTVEKTVENGSHAAIGEQPSRDGYFFFGWLTEADDTEAVDLSAIVISNDTAFYAGWNIGVDVSYYYNYVDAPDDGVYLTDKLPRGSLVAEPTAPTRGGYTFDCWTTDVDGYNAWVFSEDAAITEVKLYARWTKNATDHTVTLHIGDRTEIYSVADNVAFAEPEAPEIDGYDFVEWRVGSINGEKYDFASIVTADIELYAYFEKELSTGEHRIRYVLDDGTSTVAENARTNPTAFSEGKTVTLAAPTRACYTFDGWYADEYFNTKVTTVGSETADVTLYAKWAYNYPFFVTGDHVSWAKYTDFANFGEANTQKEECAFYPLVSGTGASRTWDGKTYVAKRVYLNASGDISSTGVKIIGYSATGANNTVWYGAQGKSSGDTNIAIAEDGYYTVTIKVKDSTSLEVPTFALRKFTVSFVTGNSEFAIDDMEYKDGSIVTEPILKGHSVDRWYTDPQKTKVWNMNSSRVTSDITLYAGNISVKKFTVAYVGQAHLTWVSAVTTADYGDALNLNYILDEGYTKSVVTVTVNNKTVSAATVVADYDDVDVIIIAASGSIALNTYTVKFSYLGNELCAPQVVKHGGTVAPPQAPGGDTGYRFAGWYDVEYGMWEESMPITSDLELMPLFEPILYTVTFDSRGGTDVPSLTDIAYGSSIDPPEEPTKPNYAFKGWYKDSACSDDKKWNFDTDKVTDDITLYAKWELDATADKYTVTLLYEKGGSTYQEFEIAAGDKIGVQAPTRNGYLFDKWYEAENDSVFDVGTAITKDITLYATWKLDAPSVTLDGISGTYTTDGYTLTAVASHLAADVTYTYKWYKDGVVIVGAVDGTYVVSDVADSGSYTVEVFAHVGELISESTTATATVEIAKAVLPNITSVAFKDGNPYANIVVFEAEVTELATHYTITVLGGESTVVTTQDIAIGAAKELAVAAQALRGDYTIQITYKGLVSDSANIQTATATQVLRFKGNGTAECPFAVEDTDDLKRVADYASAHFEQTASIDGTGVSSLFTSDAPFTGVYDGKGNTVSNFTSGRGLFGYIGTGAVVKNIVMTKVNISGGADIDYVGGIAAENGGTVTGVTVGVLSDYSKKENIDSNVSSAFGTVKGDDDVGTYAVGGIVGKNSGTIVNCVNNARIWGNKTVGGIVGYNTEEGSIENCTNNALIGTATTTASESGFMSYAGGLVGKNSGDVLQSINNGSVTAYKAKDGSGNSNNYYAGLVARNDSTGTVSECINTGTARTDYVAAGLVARNYGIVQYCINTGEANARNTVSNGMGTGNGSILYSVMIGTVSVSNSASSNGVGGSKSCSGTGTSTVKYCYYKNADDAPTSSAASNNAVYSVSSQSNIDAMLNVLGDKFVWDETNKTVTLKFTLS